MVKKPKSQRVTLLSDHLGPKTPKRIDCLLKEKHKYFQNPKEQNLTIDVWNREGGERKNEEFEGEHIDYQTPKDHEC